MTWGRYNGTMLARVIWRSILCLGIAALITIGSAWWFAIRLDGLAPARDFRAGSSYHGDGFAHWFVNVNIWLGSSWSHSEAVGSDFGDGEPVEIAAEDVRPYWAPRARPASAIQDQ